MENRSIVSSRLGSAVFGSENWLSTRQGNWKMIATDCHRSPVASFRYVDLELVLSKHFSGGVVASGA